MGGQFFEAKQRPELGDFRVGEWMHHDIPPTVDQNGIPVSLKPVMSFHMTSPAIADLIAAALSGGLVHAGDGKESDPVKVLGLPAFRAAGRPPEEAKLITSGTRMIAEAIVQLIEKDHEIVDRTTLKLLQEAHQPTGAVVAVHCRCDSTRTDPLAVLTINGPVALVDGKQLIGGLTKREAGCPHTRTPSPSAPTRG